jgi:hypothetical protein
LDHGLKFVNVYFTSFDILAVRKVKPGKHEVQLSPSGLDRSIFPTQAFFLADAKWYNYDPSWPDGDMRLAQTGGSM